MNTITVNNFFTHWIKEIDIKRYGDDMPILPLTNTVDIYRYSNKLLKQMPKNTFNQYKMICYTAKKKVIIDNNTDKRDHHTSKGENAAHRTDKNLTDRIAKF